MRSPYLSNQQIGSTLYTAIRTRLNLPPTTTLFVKEGEASSKTKTTMVMQFQLLKPYCQIREKSPGDIQEILVAGTSGGCRDLTYYRWLKEGEVPSLESPLGEALTIVLMDLSP